MRRRLVFLSAAMLTLLPVMVVYAHERFIRHDLKVPLHEEYFGRYPGMFLGMQPDMLRIATVSCVLLFTFLIIFFFRQNLDVFIEQRLLSVGLRGATQRALHHLANFLTDKPIRLPAFRTIGEWAVVMFIRSPALVLMYSATNDSLVMPSYPLEPTSALYFKYIQVFLAILMLTQTALPLAGALVVGTWIYLWRWGWMVAADAIPVLTVAVVYLTSPWQSHRIAITELNEQQVRWVRLVLGFGFFALGWLKIYNYHLTAGVADNYPGVMDDPMIGFFAMGTNPLFRRENWIVAFAFAEVLSGFMLMVGVFTRVWGSMMIWVLAKLMLVNFGFEEIPHIYPIAATMAIVFSSKVGSEFSFVERMQQKAAREGKPLLRIATVGVASLAIAVVTVYALLYALTFIDRSHLSQGGLS
jgi:uncharacterized membrane protein YphA (DoxX/SURF4 family)